MTVLSAEFDKIGHVMSINTAMAGYANVSLVSAAGVITLAMIAFASYLAGMVPARADAQLDAGGGQPVADDAATPRRARKAAGIAQALAWLGTGLLLAAAVLRGASVQRAPLGNLYEFAMVGCFFVMATFCLWGLRRDLRWLGVFVTAPVVLTLMLARTAWYTEASELFPSLKSYWLVIHVTVATLSVAVFVLGFVLVSLYLARDWLMQASVRLSGAPSAKLRRVAGLLEKLPTAAVLERLAYGAHIVAFPLWTFTLIAGAIWARQAWGSYWNWDPKEVWTFIIWVVYAAYLHARATTTTSRRTANWIAVAGFACIVFNYTIVNFYFVGQHSYSGL